MPYITWGSGVPLVVIHGMCDTARSFAMMMAPLVDAGFQIIAHELPNSLDDTANLGMYRHPHFAEDLILLLDHLKLDRVHVLGSSFGSTITLRALAMFPDRFQKAALQGGFARRPLLRIERGLARIGRYWPWRMGQLPIRETVMEKLEIHQFEGCPPEIFRFLIQCSGLSPVRAAARRALIIDQLDLRPLLPGIRTPMLMIGGDRDALVPRHLEAEVEAGVPNCRRIEFRPCGHYPQYTMPLPMAEALQAFYRG
jgi:pimeloyl-ACP methyl ester carboxylesterase